MTEGLLGVPRNVGGELRNGGGRCGEGACLRQDDERKNDARDEELSGSGSADLSGGSADGGRLDGATWCRPECGAGVLPRAVLFDFPMLREWISLLERTLTEDREYQDVGCIRESAESR